jgi:hypothetical protein
MAAKPAVQTRLTNSVASADTTRCRDRRATARISPTTTSEAPTPSTALRARPSISSVLRATLPVMRTMTPFSGTRPSSRAASRTRSIASRPGTRRWKS